ncbi:MAG: hypothetical protein IPH75_10580 [bacterium]|nr:hypothetical protein [bacterium]
MGFLASLWLPILLSAVAVFVVSSIIHMVLNYHKSDFKKLPNEDGIMEALRKFSIPPGDYHMPYCSSSKDMKDPAFTEKLNKGPVGLMTILPSGQFSMGKSLVLWFVFCLIVSLFAAYIGDRAVGPGGNYLQVFRFVGCSAFMGYAFAQMQNSIWYGRRWGTTLLVMFDGLIFALVTAGIFGWLWPKM